MELQDAVSVFQDGGGGGGGGLVVQTLPGPVGLNTAPPTLLPPEPIIPSAAAYPVPGNGVQSPPPGNIDTVPSIAVLTSTGPLPSPANPPADLPTDTVMNPPALPVLPPPVKTPWLWIVAAIGGAYFLFRDNPKRAGVSGKGKKSLLVPALIVGGVGALYLLNKKQQGATATTTTTDTGSGGTPTPTPAPTPAPVLTQDQQFRADLQHRYVGQVAQTTAIATASAGDIATWHILGGIWDAGADPYAIDTLGRPLKWPSLSIGHWWENFSATHNF